MQKKEIVNKTLKKLSKVKVAEDLKFKTKITEFSYGFKDKVLEIAKDDIIKSLQKKNKDITPENFSKKDFELNDLETNLSWNFEVEAKEWGVKSFIVHIPDQDLNVDIKEATYATDEEDIAIQDITIKVHIHNVKVSGLTQISLHAALAPQELEYYKNNFEVSF